MHSVASQTGWSARWGVVAGVALYLLLLSQPAMGQNGTWSTVAPMPTAREALAVGAANGKLYAAAGALNGSYLATLEAYDPASNTWSAKASMSTPRESSVGAAVGNVFYVFGGVNSSGYLTSVEAYDTISDTWSNMAPLPAARDFAGAGVVNGIIYVVGGYNPTSGYLSAVDAYDPATNTWTSKSPLPTPRAVLGVAVVDGILYAIGGVTCGSSTCGVLGTVEAYDPLTDTWTTRTSMPTARTLAAAAANGIIYAIAGSDASGITNKTEAYDPATDTWTSTAANPTARIYLAAASLNDLVYAVGGTTQGAYASFHAVAEVDVFTPTPPACLAPPSGMVGWWPGEGSASDAIGTNVGGLQNGASFGPGRVGQAFLLDGISQFVDLGNAPSLQVSSGDFTVDAWVKFNALRHPPGGNINGAPQGDMSIVDKMAGLNNDGWRLLKQDDDRLWFCLGGTNGGNGCVSGTAGTVTSINPVTTGIWYHVAAVKTSTDFSIYVDGVLQETRPLPPFNDTNTADLLIGAYGSQNAMLNGLVDEVELFNRALSAAEIQAIFNAGSAGKCRPQQIVLSAYSIDFGPLLVGTQSSPQTITASNAGGAALNINAVGLISGNITEFQVVTDNCSGKTLAPGGSCTIDVRFTPDPVLSCGGFCSADIIFDSDSPDGAHFVTVSGQPFDPPPTVTVLSPNGGEKIFAGTPFTIQWTASDPNTPLNNLVFAVEFSANGGVSYAPVSGCSGLSGVTSCTWLAPSPTTTQGRVRVQVSDGQNSTSDISNANYSVVSGTGSITVTQPNTLLNWVIGSSQQIRWNHNLGLNSFVMIELSRDAGASWEVLSASFKNTGATSSTFNWVVTGPATTQGRVRVTWLNGPVSDTSDVNFNIVNQTITVSQPNSAMTWLIGSSQQIKWNHNAGLASTYTISVSRDGGVTFPEVLTTSAPATTASTGIYNWTVTSPPSTTARVRVTLTSNPASTDISNVNFTIANPSVTVTQPNTNLNWGIGSTQQIKWNHNLGLAATFTIELSRDGGATYPELITASAPATTANTGVYNWTVTGPASTTARVRVTYNANPIGTDSSNVNFTIANAFISLSAPGSSVNWGYGSTQKVNWTTNLGSGDRVDVLLSTDGGATFPVTLASNIAASVKSATFTTPTLGAATTLARVRVVWAANPATFGTNPANFKVQPPFVTVSNPNLSTHVWTIGTSKTISWTNNLGSLEQVLIELSLDGGATYSVLLFGSTPSDGSQAITVQAAWATTQGRVRITWLKDGTITDISNQNFTIQ